MQRIEKLAPYFDEERWLVRVDGQLRVQWFIVDMQGWVQGAFERTRGLIGPIHPRIAVLHALEVDRFDQQNRLVVLSEDDRGPTLVEAAEQLTGLDRERWVVGQIIGVAEALAAVRARSPSFAQGIIHRERFFIDAAGHAKLRVPIAHTPHPPATRSGPMTEVFSLPYVAPESTVTPASDVFALAVNLYEALTSRLPWESDEGPTQLILKLMREPHLPIEQFPSIFERAFAKDPAARIPNPDTLAALLLQAVPEAREYDAVISDKIAAWRP